MPTDPNSINEALTNARNAFHRGDKYAARQWAERAVALAPELEDTWLVLAAVATPQASVAYLQRALEINPSSPRALQGMKWARQRMESSAGGHILVAKPLPPVTASTPVAPAKKRPSALPRVALTLFILLLAFAVIWGGMNSNLFASFPSSASEEESALAAGKTVSAPTAGTILPTSAPEIIASPTEAYTATALPTETIAPTATETPIPSETPFPTETPYPTETPKPLPTAPSVANSDKLILVDISEQHMYVYEKGTLIYSFVASTGMGNSTRVGTFAVQSKIPNAYGATWNIWMPDWLGIYYSGGLENGIHSLPILSSGARLWAGFLGTPISYGCVVLGVEESAILYNWAEIGTPVIIQW